MFGLPALPRTFAASLRDLASAKPEVRASAAGDLGRRLAELARGRARDGADGRAGDEAASADRAAGLAALGRALDDDAAAVRAAAAIALADAGEGAEAHLPRLLVLVEDDHGHVRQMALNALGEIGDARAVPRLRRALADERPEVRYQAIIAFGRLAARSVDLADELADALARAALDDDDAIAHIALRVAEERLDAGDAPSPALLARARRKLDGPPASVALAAAILLAKAGDAVGHPLLLAAVRGDRLFGEAAEKEDEAAAVELVGELGLAEAVPALERRAFGALRLVKDTCALHARIALARLGHPAARASIARDLASKRPETVLAAVIAAGRARLVEVRPALAQLDRREVDGELLDEALAQLDAVPPSPTSSG